ncbi:unnamed protein product [Effrenium voratum]|uniref:C3H1-type domain-containing protein n=1 Tax=Effrenium voratum TaxID=2562239 RepID=A0AA36I0C7_9DINO|nr:unnamed protein product [Effrenium voratum]CAJ1423818.1 unnamed protein product [Effrenium voratum]
MLIGSSCDVAHSHIAFTVLLVAMAEWIAEEAPPEQSVPFPQLVKRHLHHIGKCLPCFYHTFKGCTRGDDCSRCHICSLSEMKRQKGRLARAVKKKEQEKMISSRITSVWL